MKKILLVLLIFGCSEDSSDSSHEVLIKISRRNTVIYYFGVIVNDNEVFAATECGSSHQTAELCVNFTESHLGGYAFNYDFSASKGDKIDVLVSPEDGCYAGVSAWLYVDNSLKESDSDPCEDEDCNDCCCSFIGFSYTVD